MLTDQELEHLLNARAYTPPRTGFADRIIARARALPKRAPMRVQDLLTMLLPKPAYSFAATVIVGLVLGFGAPLTTQNSNASPLLYADEGVLP